MGRWRGIMLKMHFAQARTLYKQAMTIRSIIPFFQRRFIREWVVTSVFLFISRRWGDFFSLLCSARNTLDTKEEQIVLDSLIARLGVGKSAFLRDDLRFSELTLAVKPIHTEERNGTVSNIRDCGANTLGTDGNPG